VGTILKVAPPAGEFFLAEHPERPVVLLSGGVGLTPMVAMLETIAARHKDVQTYYIHGTHDRETHAMRDHVPTIAANAAAIEVVDFHQTPLSGEVAGKDYDHAGIITDEWLIANTPVGAADF
jgi:nitric oxide dioxygenase